MLSQLLNQLMGQPKTHAASGGAHGHYPAGHHPGQGYGGGTPYFNNNLSWASQQEAAHAWAQSPSTSPYASAPPSTTPAFGVQGSSAVYAPNAVDAANPFAQAAVASAQAQSGARLLHQRLPADYGVNKPLKRAMFMGYHNDQPLYVGENLYISC